jgi:hypothetical protein
MALIAMTTADQIEYVSDLDPAKSKKKTPYPPVKGEHSDAKPVEIEEIVIGPNATIFKIRGLDVFLKAFIYDSTSSLTRSATTDDVGIHTKMNQTNIEAVRHGLVGFDNFRTPKGGSIPFETERTSVNGRNYDVVSDKILNLLGIRLIQELANEIKNISEVKAEEEKKSVAA